MIYAGNFSSGIPSACLAALCDPSAMARAQACEELKVSVASADYRAVLKNDAVRWFTGSEFKTALRWRQRSFEDKYQ